jgi:hypothetical protein
VAAVREGVAWGLTGPSEGRDSSLFVPWPTVMARRHAPVLIQARTQIPATDMFRHLVPTVTLPGPGGVLAEGGRT